ncbi:MAG: glycosyltransferase family 4 protein [Myxococcota bacterium]|nr:glycosyltransferase family 4 protein [Myxococcota bacterium]
MRVVLVSEYYYPDVGGIPEHLHHLGRHLARRGHQVTILTTCFPGLEGVPVPADPALEVIRLGRSSRPVLTNGSVSRAAVGLGLGRQVRALLAARRFDVIHVHGPLFPVLPLLAIRHAPPASALVATLHTHFGGSAIMRLLRPLLQRYLDVLDGIVAVSASAAASLHRLGFRFCAQIVPNGVDLAYWSSGQRLPWVGDDIPTILIQARLEPRNRVELVLAALGRLPSGTARLILVGDGPCRGALQAAVPPGHRQAVHFVGTQIARRPDYARSADIYCFTADMASHPMSLLEGMAAGLPVVCQDVAGVRELVRPEREGLIVPLGDVEAWAQALARLARDPLLRRQMGEAARQRAAAFAWPILAERVEAIYVASMEARARRCAGDESARGCGAIRRHPDRGT